MVQVTAGGRKVAQKRNKQAKTKDMNTDKVNEIVMRMMIIAPALTPDNRADVERMKELAIELFAELDK